MWLQVLSLTASKVTESLWVGDWQDAKEAREAHHLVEIVTTAFDSPFVGDVQFMLVDGPADGNEKIFWEAVKQVESLQSGGVLTLVHCVAGVSRSCSVVIAYLMKSQSIDYNAALTELRKVRPSANPQPFFENLLRNEKEQ